MEAKETERHCHQCNKIIDTFVPFQCSRCKNYFCEDHRLPEQHNCSSYETRLYWGKKTGQERYKEALMRGESEDSARTRGGYLTKEEERIKEFTIIDPFEEDLPKKLLTSITKRSCPKCGSYLYDTRHDGIWYYCSKCKKQHHKNWIR